MSEVKLITFNNFANVVAEVEVLFDKIILKQPMQVIMQPDETGTTKVGFYPFLAISEQYERGIPISRSEILCITDPILDIRNSYAEIFNKITLPNSMNKIQTI